MSRAIEDFTLALEGLTILTEAASGNFIFTSLIAAGAGAKRVYAITRDSRYGSKDKVKDDTLDFAGELGISNIIEVVFDKDPEIIREADIITNLGFVRPINKDVIRCLKPTAVIPLMWETWEYRERDLDLRECISRQIPVLGTDEKIPPLKTFEYIGYVALKLSFELNIEVLRSNILVVGSGHFGESIVKAFFKNRSNVFWVTHEKSQDEKLNALIKGNRLNDMDPSLLQSIDLIVLGEHKSHDLILGRDGQISFEMLCKLNPFISIAHISGNIDLNELRHYNISCLPREIAPPGHMSVTTDYVGPKPTIDLHTAGLKVGEIMARNRLKGLNFEETIQESLKNPICQHFSENRKTKYGYYD